jgi:1,4-dihydroxy-2-naphthoate octaprenyltransferase
LQILSNLANDYGDSEKGTDNENRIGPKRAVQAGMLSLAQMKNGVIVAAIFALISGLALIYLGLKDVGFNTSFFFLLLGLAAIAAAIKYTMGKNAYGYLGLGDVFVFIFFGLVGVMGSFFLQTKSFDFSVLLIATTIGCFSAAVLNLNNMRDEESDKSANKNTLVVKIGGAKAKRYSFTLLLVGWLAANVFVVFNFVSITQFFFVLSLPIFIKIQKAIFAIENLRDYDPFLKQMAIATFIFSLLFAFGHYLAINI